MGCWHPDRERGGALQLPAVRLLLHGRDRRTRLAARGTSRASASRSPTRSCCSPRASRRGGANGGPDRRRPQALVGFALAFVMGTVFALVQCYEWHTKPFSVGTSSYSSLYFLTTGIHIAHVLVGLAVLAAIFLWTALDYFSPRRRLSVSAGVLYWHFVDIVWLFVFTTYYLTPYLGFGV